MQLALPHPPGLGFNVLPSERLALTPDCLSFPMVRGAMHVSFAPCHQGKQTFDKQMMKKQRRTEEVLALRLGF